MVQNNLGHFNIDENQLLDQVEFNHIAKIGRVMQDKNIKAQTKIERIEGNMPLWKKILLLFLKYFVKPFSLIFFILHIDVIHN